MTHQDVPALIEVQQTLYRLFLHFDRREHRQAADLMAADGVWERQGRQLRGPDGAFAILEERPPGRTTLHLLTNVLVDLVAEGRADAVFYITTLRHDGAEPPRGPVPIDLPSSAYIFHAALRRTPEGWRIAAMRSEQIFVR